MLQLDAGRFAKHFSEFVALADAGPGLAAYVALLEAKHRLFAGLLAAPQRVDLGAAESLLDSVFTARRKLYPVLEALGAAALSERVARLLSGEATIDAFCDSLDYPQERAAQRKLRGAARDFAAELLHFADPQAHPLMTRWVWDASSGSGALREMMNAEHAGAMDHAAARGWMYERFGEQGIWREQHWLADLVLAMAYVGYFRAMTGGVLGSDFTRASTPDEQLRKLLGVDGGARSRVRKSSATIH
ncbi:MAG TPA: hypothetical protein VEG36_10280 [Burkholderiales bacterium]|nr:hypothetical protein [Burkholderiales bacterium]